MHACPLDFQADSLCLLDGMRVDMNGTCFSLNWTWSKWPQIAVQRELSSPFFMLNCLMIMCWRRLKGAGSACWWIVRCWHERSALLLLSLVWATACVLARAKGASHLVWPSLDLEHCARVLVNTHTYKGIHAYMLAFARNCSFCHVQFNAIRVNWLEHEGERLPDWVI